MKVLSYLLLLSFPLRNSLVNSKTDSCQCTCHNPYHPIRGFQRCVNDWCYQHGTNQQYTKCKNASEDGRTCYNPTIRYGTAIGGIPAYNHYERRGSIMKAWCHQLFPEYNILSGLASYDSKFIYFKGWLIWCNHGDEPNPHWCDWQGGFKWKDSTLDAWPGANKAMTSVTCNFPKT